MFGLIWYWPLISTLLRPSLISYAPAKAQETKLDNHIYYPSLGIVSPIKISPETSPLKYKDWSEIRASLFDGVSLAFIEKNFAESNFNFITGHSSDIYPHKYAAIFASLGQAVNGDEITIKIEGVEQRYKVVDKKILDPRNIKAFNELRSLRANIKRIVLVTCWPLLTTKNRMVIIADQEI